MTAAVLGVDVGNSKTDVALVGADGRLLAAVRGPTGSHQRVGLEPASDVIVALAAEAARQAGLDGRLPLATVGAFCLAGADTPADERRLARSLGGRGLTDRLIVRNDTFAALRAGTDRGWGIAVIAGSGINGLGVGPTGRTVRFEGLGDPSGDWGGGYDLGMAALGAAARAKDGRGPRTVLEQAVPAALGMSSVSTVSRRIHDGGMPGRALAALASVVFNTAAAGDAVAAGIVDRLAEEMAAFATASIRRLHVTRREVDVVLAGGLVRSRDGRLLDGVGERVRAVAPRARIVVVDAPPVLGASLLGLDEVAGGQAKPATAETLRRELADASDLPTITVAG